MHSNFFLKMKPSFYFKIIFSLGCMLIHSNQNVLQKNRLYNEGDVCLKGVEGSDDHFCKKPENCSLLNQNAVSNSVCISYDDKPLVCCPPVARNVTTNSYSTSIASKMCSIYAKINTSESKNNVIPKSNLNSGKVYGGVKTKPKEFPHMVFIIGFTPKYIFTCSGTLISDVWVMSAAHCAYNDGHAATHAILGRTNVIAERFDPKVKGHYEIKNIVVHPNYVDWNNGADIALYRLKMIVKFTDFIRPICLDVNPILNVKKATACGWGYTGVDKKDENESNSSPLMKVALSIISKEECAHFYNTISQHTLDGMICAGSYMDGGNDTCHGDSGGPLQINNVEYPNMFTEIGITSFGFGNCSNNTYPGGYTRISHYIGWIEKIVWPQQTF